MPHYFTFYASLFAYRDSKSALYRILPQTMLSFMASPA